MLTITDYVGIHNELNDMLLDLYEICDKKEVEALEESFLIKLLMNKNIMLIKLENKYTEEEKINTLINSLLGMCVDMKYNFGIELNVE